MDRLVVQAELVQRWHLPPERRDQNPKRRLRSCDLHLLAVVRVDLRGHVINLQPELLTETEEEEGRLHHRRSMNQLSEPE